MRSQKLVSAGFAIIALASASIPALAYTVWPDIDFGWYDNPSPTTKLAAASPVGRDRDGNVISTRARNPATR